VAVPRHYEAIASKNLPPFHPFVILDRPNWSSPIDLLDGSTFSSSSRGTIAI
jgi:hypothetical protein